MYHVQGIADPTTNKLWPTVRNEPEKLEAAIETAKYVHKMSAGRYHYVVVDTETDLVVYRTDRPQS